MSNPIQVENNQVGTSNWRISSIATTQIAAYADKLTLDPGQTITFFVSTQVASTTYTLTIYRLGSYAGNLGGSLKNTQTGLVGVAQGYWDGTTLQSCPTAVIDSTTHRVEAGWASSCSWAVPASACTGVYMAQFTDANGFQCACTFVVHGTGTEDYAYVRAETTDYAYNTWGGYSLYSTPTTATKISFNRPNTEFGGTGGLLGHEMAGIRWLESQGYNIGYLSLLDVHANPSVLQNYKGVLFAGHSEYWTKEMRDSVDGCIASGTGLAILGANACYWQIRMETSSTSVANRTIVCYKVQSAGQVNAGPGGSIQPLSNDPDYGVDNTRVTTLWRDPLLNRPEYAFTGNQYVLGNHYSQFELSNIAWTVDSGAGVNSLLAGTGLVAGSSYGIDGVGYEWDGGAVAGVSPTVQTIGTTATVNISSQASVSNTVFYIASSGSRVFSSGSVNFVNMLDTYRWTTPTQSGNRVSPPVQLFIANVLQQLSTGKNAKAFSVLAAHI